ncbi:hypothetical protein ACQ4M3_01095 [Leptolyngbya sp. AN03gr2]|uniref:hypothetical protein n=1 Tax=unclassified Leptolyngbya TaxID=2650499 RepID=UPI003D3155E2
MSKFELSQWQFKLLIRVGCLCSIATIAGFIISVGAYATSIAFKSSNPSYSEQASALSEKTTNITLVSLIGAIAVALTASRQSDPDNEETRVRQNISFLDDEDVSFFEESDLFPVDQGIPYSSCRFLNPDTVTRCYLWCSEEPLRKTCDGCTKYTN